MSEDWSRAEVEATVADYLEMYHEMISGRTVNKALHNRDLVAVLNGRTRGAVEFKHANISAALHDLGYPYIEGYKPRSNYQHLLLEVLIERLAENPQLAAATQAAVDRPALETPDPLDYRDVLVHAPKREIARPSWKERRQEARQPRVGVNYLERESRNASLGLAGERLVMTLEHKRLWTAGKRKLAERLEHVSHVRGDGLGYDIHSFEESGRDRLIEVKTTRFGVMTPFFVSRNEVEVSVERSEHYQLFRLFRFDSSPPKLFMLGGSLRLSCLLEPTQFEASLP